MRNELSEFPDEGVREILASCRGITLEGMGDERRQDFREKIGFVEIGMNRLYETMVFKAVPAEEEDSCCPWRIHDSGNNVDFAGYNSPEEAFKGHLSLCEKWDRANSAETLE